MKLNIVRSAVINHAAVMLGQFEGNGIAQFGLKANKAISESVREQTIRDMNLLWGINDTDSIMLEQALMQQIFGGCLFKIGWTPSRKKWPIRYFKIDPRAAFFVWDGVDYNRLVSIDVHYEIPTPTAVARYKMSLPASEMPEMVMVREHWDENEFFIYVNEEPAKWADGADMSGENPFTCPIMGHKIIPFVYIPRIRAGDEIFGEPLPPGLMGAQDELNNNMAHLSEGLADAMHEPPWVRNRSKGTSGLTTGRNEWIDLGMSQFNQSPPEAGRLPGAKLTDPMIDLVTNETVRLAREHTNLPDVAWGHTDASVRSALTLKFMMWPTINVGLHYRQNFATGLKYLNYYAFVMAFSNGKFSDVVDIGIKPTEESIEAILLSHKTTFASMLPDDRAEKVNEVVQRLGVGVLSPQHAILMLDGPDELEEELNRIDEHRAKLAEEAQATMEKQAELGMQADAAKEKAKASKPAPDRTNKAQAVGGRAKNGGK